MGIEVRFEACSSHGWRVGVLGVCLDAAMTSHGNYWWCLARLSARGPAGSWDSTTLGKRQAMGLNGRPSVRLALRPWVRWSMTRVTELADPSLAQRPRAKKPTEVEQLSLTVDGEERDGEMEMEMRDGVWLVNWRCGRDE